MSLINTEIKPLKATAYHNGKFVPVTNADLNGKWSVLVFYPADFTFVCPTELGDPTATLARNFEVLIEEEGLALRRTFVIEPAGKIKVMEVHDNGIGRDAKELLRKVQAARYVASHPGEVCPAKWIPGAKTLAPSLDLVGKI